MAQFANRVVIAVLQSPLHRVLSGSTGLVRYTASSGRTVVTPTQYTTVDDGVVILVGHPEAKTWWRHFRTEQPIEILRNRQWTAMTAQTLTGADQPEEVAPLLDSYLARFPRAARALDGATRYDKVRPHGSSGADLAEPPLRPKHRIQGRG